MSGGILNGFMQICHRTIAKLYFNNGDSWNWRKRYTTRLQFDNDVNNFYFLGCQDAKDKVGVF